MRNNILRVESGDHDQSDNICEVIRNDPPENPLVSLILPIYNEAEIIGKNMTFLCDFMKRENYELIVCDDCSTDETCVTLKEAAKNNPRITLLHFGRRRGKGATIKAAAEVARGRIVLIMDADLSTDLRYIHLLIEQLMKRDLIVIGERCLSDKYTQGLFRVLMSLGYNTLVKLLFGTELEDHQCGFKGMRTDTAKLLARRIVNDGFLFDTELIVVAKQLRIPVKSIKVRWTEFSPKEKSNFGWLRIAFIMMRDLVRLRL